MPRIPLHPKHPERTCWGCNLYCPADELRCGNGTIRTPHPFELFGEDWVEAEPPAEFHGSGGPRLRPRHESTQDVESGGAGV